MTCLILRLECRSLAYRGKLDSTSPENVRIAEIWIIHKVDQPHYAGYFTRFEDTIGRFGLYSRARSLWKTQEHSSKRSEASQQTSRSAPGERSKYQLWPALDQRTQKPLPGSPDPAVVPFLDRKRSVRVHQSAEQMCRVYEGASDPRPQQSMHSSKRTQASSKDPQQPMLGVGM